MKGTILGVEAIHVTEDIDVLKHQNKELYSHVRRLRRKIKQKNQTLQAKATKENEEQAFYSAVERHWKNLEQTLHQVLSQFKGTAADGPPKKKPRVEADVLTSFLPLLCQPCSPWLKKNPLKLNVTEDEEEDDTEEKAVSLADLDKALDEKVSFTSKLFSEVLKSLSSSDATADTMETAKTELRDAKSEARAYLHRVIHLQKELKRVQDKLEDTVIERDVAVRRLNGWKSLGKVDPVKKEEAVEEKNASAVVQPESDDVVKKEPEESSAVSDEVEALRDLAEQRLKELEQVKEERIRLSEGMERLRHQTLNRTKSPRSAAQEETLQNTKLALEITQKQVEELQLQLKKAEHVRQEEEDRAEKFRKLVRRLEIGSEDRFRIEKCELQDRIDELQEKNLATAQKLKRSRGDKVNTEELNSKIRNFEKLLQASNDEKELLRQQVERLKGKPKTTSVDQQAKDNASPEVSKLKAELQEATETAEAYLTELDAMSQKEIDAKQQLQKALKKVQEKTSTNAKLSKQQYEFAEKIRKLQFSAKVKDGQLINEQQARGPMEAQLKALTEKQKALEELVEKAESMSVESEVQNRKYRLQVKQLNVDLETKKEEIEVMKAKVDNYEKHNIVVQKEKIDAVHSANRVKEDFHSLKKKFDKMKKMNKTNNSGNLTDVELKLQTMENHLRCPVYRQYWKDTIIISCCHMFSKHALVDNLAKRNRKCPTCKNNYSKDHMRDIVPYQENVEED